MRLQSHRHCNLALRLAWNPRSRHISSTVLRQHGEDRQLRDIIPGDLTATLEAHRASNRASIIRKIKTSQPALLDSEERGSETLQEQNDDAVHASDDGRIDADDVAGESPPGQRFGMYRIRDDVQSALPDGMPERKVARLVRRLIVANTKKEVPSPASVNPELYRYGRYIKLPRALQASKESSFQPWEDETSRAELDKKKRLSRELANLQNWLLLSPSEKQFRRHLTNAVTSSFKERDEDVEFYTFGSSETGLATTMSDIDIGFIIPSIQKTPGQRGPSSGLGQKENRKKVFRLLQRFCINSCAQNKYRNPEVVYARYPLLRMTHKASNVEIQIVAGAARPSVMELTKTYIDEYPQLVPIYLVLKATLAARELDEPRTGGVGSYTLFMMTVAAFKNAQMPRRMDLSTALLTVLRFYGDLDTMLQCVAVDPPAKFVKRHTPVIAHGQSKAQAQEKFCETTVFWSRFRMSLVHDTMPYLLCLQDPADPENDLGRGAWRIKDICKTFRELLTHISLYFNDKGALETKQQTALQHLLGTSLDKVGGRRESFRQWSTGHAGRVELKRLREFTKAAEKMEMRLKKEKLPPSENLSGIDDTSADSMDEKEAYTGADHDDYDHEIRAADEWADAESMAGIDEMADEDPPSSSNKITTTIPPPTTSDEYFANIPIPPTQPSTTPSPPKSHPSESTP